MGEILNVTGTNPRADLQTGDFDFELPSENIATEPARPRESAKLLEVGETLVDHTVADLPSLLTPGDVVVINDTRVIPARLRGTRRGAKVQVTLHKAEADGTWKVFARPARKLSTGDIIDFADGFTARVEAKGEAGEVTLSFPGADDLFGALAKHGEMPLPPYISRPGGATTADENDYQTVYAARQGAVAAPTAGLHFTDGLMEAVRAAGAQFATVTLHVGAGTFLPVKVDRIADHRMHSEWGEIDADTAATINAARAAGGRIVSVGTTPLRLLETAATEDGKVHPFTGDTDIFITPGYRFKAVDTLMTNFHLPRSTLFMLVSAFAGLDRMRAAYQHAIQTGYRFYSYGDSSLLHKVDPT
ncbi:MAG: tRNA preQ1(34) S-adenosylmethionine ribosyltransferase-isomerase QueA [Rhodospirillaceae bacterium]|jgi:S-adenosylmethionine:tRNA ribosyltransferase-isomerase|nr:tRNA preQ1(34) S-adenosylmethionine ribosyltransferase-isomerase QueA [Rhodospirillaceae bacterium]